MGGSALEQFLACSADVPLPRQHVVPKPLPTPPWRQPTPLPEQQEHRAGEAEIPPPQALQEEAREQQRLQQQREAHAEARARWEQGRAQQQARQLFQEAQEEARLQHHLQQDQYVERLRHAHFQQQQQLLAQQRQEQEQVWRAQQELHELEHSLRQQEQRQLQETQAALQQHMEQQSQEQLERTEAPTQQHSRASMEDGTQGPTKKPKHSEGAQSKSMATSVGNGKSGDIIGKNKAPGEPAWPSRAELRDKGHGKGNRPRGGGAKAKWYTTYHKLIGMNRSHEDVLRLLGPPPMSNSAMDAIVERERAESSGASVAKSSRDT